MNKLFVILFCFVFACVNAQQLKSPSKDIVVDFSLGDQGEPTYHITYKGKEVLKPSKMGVLLKDGNTLNKNFRILNVETSAFDENWTPVLGEEAVIRNHYNQMTMHLEQKESDQKMDIVFSVYEKGVAFRYEFPFEYKSHYFIMSDETTEFNLTGKHKTFWHPGDYDSQEYNYNETIFSENHISKIDRNNGIALHSVESNYRVQTPLMLKSDNNLYLNIFEATVTNYPVMHLDVDTANYTLASNLVPNAIGDKAYLRTPSTTPWRTFMVSDDARD